MMRRERYLAGTRGGGTPFLVVRPAELALLAAQLQVGRDGPGIGMRQVVAARTLPLAAPV
jgi:hypothetical protein